MIQALSKNATRLQNTTDILDVSRIESHSKNKQGGVQH